MTTAITEKKKKLTHIKHYVFCYKPWQVAYLIQIQRHAQSSDLIAIWLKTSMNTNWLMLHIQHNFLKLWFKATENTRMYYKYQHILWYLMWKRKSKSKRNICIRLIHVLMESMIQTFCIVNFLGLMSKVSYHTEFRNILPVSGQLIRLKKISWLLKWSISDLVVLSNVCAATLTNVCAAMLCRGTFLLCFRLSL